MPDFVSRSMERYSIICPPEKGGTSPADAALSLRLLDDFVQCFLLIPVAFHHSDDAAHGTIDIIDERNSDQDNEGLKGEGHQEHFHRFICDHCHHSFHAGQRSSSLCRPAFFVSGQEVLIVVGGEIVLSAAAASHGLAVPDLLQVVQPAGDTLVAIAVEGVQVDAGSAIDAGVHLGAIQDGIAVRIHDSRSGAAVGVDEHAPGIGGIALALLVAVTEGQLQALQVRDKLAVAAQLALAFLIRGLDSPVDLLDGGRVGLRDDQGDGELGGGTVDGLGFPDVRIRPAGVGASDNLGGIDKLTHDLFPP